jgi:hypothetical protein
MSNGLEDALGVDYLAPIVETSASSGTSSSERSNSSIIRSERVKDDRALSEDEERA